VFGLVYWDCQDGFRALPDHDRCIAIGCRLHWICSSKERTALDGAYLGPAPNLQLGEVVLVRPICLVAGFRAQPMRTAAPPRGPTAEHLAFNLPQGEACSAVHYGKFSGGVPENIDDANGVAAFAQA